MSSDFAIMIYKKPVKNFWKGRGGFLPIAIVERMMQGRIEDAEQYFNGRSPEGVFAVSAHYGIARDGRVWQFVDDEDTAWSNGVLQNPDLSIDWLKEVYQEKVNCNLVTLSVDYEGYSGEPLTSRQYEAALALHRQLVQQWDIEADNHHIIGHNWIDSLDRSHNPGPLFPFNQLIGDLNAPPAVAEPVQPTPPNPLAFLETPMPETEAEATPPPTNEVENVAAYQPETAEEPAYRPQVESFTFTPGLNEEVDQVTAAPTEVDPATAEPEPVQTETFQDTAAYQPEVIEQETVYQPEEIQGQPAEEAAPAYQLEEVQPETPYESYATYLPPEEIAAVEPEAAVEAEPEVAQAESSFEPDEAPPEEGQYDELPVEAAPSAEQAESVEAEPASEITGEPAEEAATEPVETAPETPATSEETPPVETVEEPGEPTEEAAYEAETAPEETAAPTETESQTAELEPEISSEPSEAAVPSNETAPIEEAHPETESQSEETAAEVAPEPDVEALTQSADSDVDDILADLAYTPKSAKTAPRSRPGTSALAAQPAPVQPEAAPQETQLETVEPEAVQAEPAAILETQPEVFDAPGQPENLAEVETAAFEAAGPATEQTEAVEPLTEEASAEHLAEETSGEDAPEQVAPTQVEDSHDDWAADVFADEPFPALENDALTAIDETAVDNESATGGQPEVSSSIGDDITPKYFRPEFFDPTHTSEPTPFEEATEAEEVASLAPVEEVEPVPEDAATPTTEDAAPLSVEVAPEQAASAEVAPEQVVPEAAEPAVEEPSVEAVAPSEPEAATFAETVPAQEVAQPTATVSTVEAAPEEKHHWYDGIKRLFGGHEDKPDQSESSAIPLPSQAPAVIQGIPYNQVEAAATQEEAATLPEVTGAVPAVDAPEENTAAEAYQPDYAAEQEIFRDATDAPSGTVEAATEQVAPAPDQFEPAPVTEPDQPALESAHEAPDEAASESVPAEIVTAEEPDEVALEPTTSELAQEVVQEAPAETASEQAAPEAAPAETVAQQIPVNPPVETPPVEESFYPFELDKPSATNYDNYYQSGDSKEQASQSSNYDFNPSAPYSQPYGLSGPSDYPFELPSQETPSNYFQSFAAESPVQPAEVTPPSAPTQPIEAAQPPEPVIPPFSFGPEASGDVFFDTSRSSSDHPKFGYDDLELPSWLNEPESFKAEETTEAAQSSFSQPAQSAPPVPNAEPVSPSSQDFAWASGSSSQQTEPSLPGWLQDSSNDEQKFPDWLNDAAEPVDTGVETTPPAQSSQPTPPAFRDTPAVEIPNKDWQENENLFEDDDFFSQLNQSGLELSMERGGTGTLPSTGSLPGGNPPLASETPTNQPTPIAPAPTEATPQVASPVAPPPAEPKFESYFDEVITTPPAPPPPAKMTVRQLIDRNDGYTAPLSYEDLDMSVPFGLEEDLTAPPTAPATPPARQDPPGFRRLDMGGGQTSVELANIRSVPSYDKETVIRVTEQGERFLFDGWIEGPELRGSNRWYRIATNSGDQWIHSTLVQLDRPFRG